MSVLEIYVISLLCGIFTLFLIDVWLRLRGARDKALIWIYVSLLSWVVAIGAELSWEKLKLDKRLNIEVVNVKYLFSIFSSVLWVWTTSKLARVQEALSLKHFRIARNSLFGIVVSISLIAWLLVIKGNPAGPLLDVVASNIAGLVLGIGLTYSFYKYGNWLLAGLTAVVFLIFVVQKQIHIYWFGRPTTGFWAAYYFADFLLMIMIFIALAIAWALSDISRLKPSGDSEKVNAASLVLDLRGSTAWAHETVEGDFHHVRDFVDEWRERIGRQARTALSEGRLHLIKGLGDGFLFVWEIPNGSAGNGCNGIVEFALNLNTDYKSWIEKPEFKLKFPWGAPAGIGFGFDYGSAIRLTLENGSDDYLGTPLNNSAKLQDFARPRGGVIREKIWRLLDERLRSQFPNRGTVKIGGQLVDVRATEEVVLNNQ